MNGELLHRVNNLSFRIIPGCHGTELHALIAAIASNANVLILLTPGQAGIEKK
jgi:hypothetical protein